MKHWLKHRHRFNHRCKRRVADEIDASPLNLTKQTVYAHIGIACDGPEIRMCAMW